MEQFFRIPRSSHFFLVLILTFGSLPLSAQGAELVLGAGGQMLKAKSTQHVGAQAAIEAAIGKVTQQEISYAEAALIGLAVIMNDNDNDGEPATFTGGSGSNMAGGSG